MAYENIFSNISKHIKFKGTKGKWKTFDAVCCPHNGAHRPDRKGRGGVIVDGNGSITFNCFNCKYSTRWTPGHRISNKFRKLLIWLGFTNEELKRFEFQSFLIEQNSPQISISYETSFLKFDKSDLPENSKSLIEWIDSGENSNLFLNVLDYASRRLYGDLTKYEIYWTNKSHQTIKGNTVRDLSHRIIIPFKWNNEIVGWTARSIEKTKYRYFSDEPPNYLFNTESINDSDDMIFLVEGPFDALAIDGVATLGDRCSQSMIAWLNDQNKKIVVVPDMEKKGGSIVDIAIREGWYVSIPRWDEGIKDACDAVNLYGKLYTVQSIINSMTNNKLLISVTRNLYIKGSK